MKTARIARSRSKSRKGGVRARPASMKESLLDLVLALESLNSSIPASQARRQRTMSEYGHLTKCLIYPTTKHLKNAIVYGDPPSVATISNYHPSEKTRNEGERMGESVSTRSRGDRCG
jgi:hypothetical protein